MSPIVNVFGRTRAAVTASRRGVQRRCASSCRAHGPPVIEATRHSLGYGGVCATQACRWVHHGAVSRQVGGRHARGDTGALTVSCWRAALVGRCLRSQAPAIMTTLPSAEVVFKEDSQCKQCHASFNFVRRRVRRVLTRPPRCVCVHGPAPLARGWVPAHGASRSPFSLVLSCSRTLPCAQHHCRACGNSFCDAHAPKRNGMYVCGRHARVAHGVPQRRCSGVILTPSVWGGY